MQLIPQFTSWLENGIEITEKIQKQEIAFMLDENNNLNTSKLKEDFDALLPDSLKGRIKLFVTPSLLPRANSRASLLPLAKCLGSVSISSGYINLIANKYPNNPEKMHQVIKAILGHEIGHIVNKHYFWSFIFQTFTSILSINFTITEKISFSLSSFLQTTVQNWMKRHQEYQADQYAVDNKLGPEMIESLSIFRNRNDILSEQKEITKNNTDFFTKYMLHAYNAIGDTVETITEYDHNHPTFLNRKDAIMNATQKLN